MRRHTLHRPPGVVGNVVAVSPFQSMGSLLRRNSRPVCDYLRQNGARSRRVAAVYLLTGDRLSPCVIGARADQVGPFRGGPS